MNRDEISLASLSYQGMIRELLKNWWMIVLAALSMWLLVSGIGKLLYVPQYSVSATLAVSAEGENNTYTSLTMANQMATVIKEIFESDALVSLVKEDVGTTSPASVSCTQVSETNLLVITVSSENPQDAYQFMNSALKHYDDVSDYVFSNAELRVLQEPSVPTAPANVPMLWNYRYFIGLAGGVMMAGMIILLYCFRHTVKTSKSAVKLLDGKIRGIIPFEKKKGNKSVIQSKSSLLITSSTVSMNFAEANRRMASRVQGHLDRKQQKILLNVSVAENEGKSTIVSNLALALAEKNKKVLLVDGDLKKPALYKIFDNEILDFNPIEVLLNKKMRVQDAIIENSRYHFWELFLYHPVQNATKVMDSTVLKKLFTELQDNYDYIIIDCSPTTVATDAEVWMEVADSCMITVREDWSDIRTINDTVDLIWQSGCDFAGFVLNSFREDKMMDRHNYNYGYSAYGHRINQESR